MCAVSKHCKQLWHQDTNLRKAHQQNKEVRHLENQHFPAGVCEGTAEEEAVHNLVEQPIENHLPVPWTNRNPQLEAARITWVVVVAGKNADHFHVEGDGWADGDGGKLIGHFFPVNEYSTCGRNVTIISIELECSIYIHNI